MARLVSQWKGHWEAHVFAHRSWLEAVDVAGAHDDLFVRVLGPVDFVVDGAVVAPGSRLERKLLAALAVSANHSVTAHQLADVLWGDDPPASRTNTLQTYVSRLRHSLGHGRITSEANSYLLQLAPSELDALAFEQLVTRAARSRDDVTRCRAICADALDLWRGTAFGTFAAEDPFRLEALRLEEIRLYALELTLECDLRLGNVELAVGSLEALVEEHPYRERLWALLVAGLAMSERRVEALRAGDKLRHVLGDLGLEPSAGFSRLEDEILNDRPDLKDRMRALVVAGSSTGGPSG
jgi:DNA-binding SARP family transcriptional activator